jgi:SsrA-binding protein
MPPAPSPTRPAIKTMATHRKAFRDYHVLERIEAGIELRGAEVKSIREGRFSLTESHAIVDGGQVLLMGLHVQPYACSRAEEHDPLRPKRLLLHRREIDRLAGQVAVKGCALVPLRVYFKKGLVKIELALGKGKQSEDKRETLKRRTAEREAERAIASRTRRRA